MTQLALVKGIGPKTLEKLHQNNIFTGMDLLKTTPKKYEVHEIQALTSIVLAEEMTLVVSLLERPTLQYIRKKLTKLTLKVSSGQFHFQVVLFNREFLSKSLIAGEKIVVKGQFKKPSEFVASEAVKEKNYVLGILPVYGIEGISDKLFLSWVDVLLPEELSSVEESLPQILLQKRELLDQKKMLSSIHHPKSLLERDEIVKRLKYEELLAFFAKLEAIKKEFTSVTVHKKPYDIEKIRTFIKTLPFELTEDQKQATNDIFRDFQKHRQMNRLLQGDVGSGKTICAMIACYGKVTMHEQVAFMAPTEILAMQHHAHFTQMFQGLGISIELLTSSTPKTQRKAILTSLSKGQIDVIIGTHSLLQDDVFFKDLGFVIIDEQHRFGVAQRRLLRMKGYSPDVLLMTATPIPRTLAITLFNDMDISSIKMLPKGRKTIQTKLITLEEIDEALETLKLEIEMHHQAYAIVPKIESSENTLSLSVFEFAQIIEEKYPGKLSLGILHGRMKGEEKEQILRQFYDNEISLLISTTVVEVGLNVPNATLMMIVNANRFGLSQLHQLRGRIGRGSHASTCYLIRDEDALDNERLNIICSTTDGFEIAESDLKFRGPGEIFGFLQQGDMPFESANFMEDQHLMEWAMQDVKEMNTLNDPIWKKWMEKIQKKIDTYHLD